MSESDLRALFSREMRRFGLSQPIESPDTGLGIPDNCVLLRRPHAPRDPGVGGVTSWVELKHAHRWPPRGGPLKFEHYTNDQRLWLKSWHEAGGRCCLLMQVGRDYALLPPWRTCELYYDGMTRARALEAAAVSAEGRFPTAEVMKWLTR